MRPSYSCKQDRIILFTALPDFVDVWERVAKGPILSSGADR